MHSDEYFIPSVRSHTHAAGQHLSDAKSITASAAPVSEALQSRKDQLSHSKQNQPSQRSQNLSQQRPQSAVQSKGTVPSQQNAATDAQKSAQQKKETTDRPQSAVQYEPAPSSEQSRPATAASHRSNLLDWNIVQVQHKPTTKNEQYRKGVTFQETATIKKQKSHKYWQNTKVDTCAFIVIRDGVPLAVPSFKKPPKTYAENVPRSVYHKSLANELLENAVKPVSKAGDRYKPLQKYDPNASRNHLPDAPYVKPQTNVSQFKIGDQQT